MNAFPKANKFRERVLVVLESLLAHSNSLSRCCAIRAIRRIDPDGARGGEKFLALLADPDPDVRGDAAEAVGRLKMAGAVKPLADLLRGDAEGSVRIQAVSALIGIGSADVVAPLIHCLEHEGYPDLDTLSHDLDFHAAWEVHARALAGLGEVGDARAVAPILALVESGVYEDLEESAFRSLARIGTDEAHRGLLRQLRSGSRTARRRAVSVLAGLLADEGGRRDELSTVRVELVRALSDPEPAVRAAAARALAGGDEHEVAESLTALLVDSEFAVREAAVEALAKLKKGQTAIPRLHEVLRGDDEKLKRSAACALGEIGDETSTVALLPLLESNDLELALAAVSAIGRIGKPGAEVRLVTMVADRQAELGLRIQAAEALGQLARNAREGARAEEVWATAGDALTAASSEDDVSLAFAGLTALAEIDRDRAVARMTDILGGNRGSDRAGPASEEHATPVVAKSIDELPAEWTDGNPETSTLASLVAGLPNTHSEAISAPEPKGSLPVHPEMAVIAARLLGGMDRIPAAAVDALRTAAGSSDDALRAAALLALGRVGGAGDATAVARALRATKPEVRLAAFEALSHLAPQGIPEVNVAALLEDPDSTMRSQALRALADAGGPAAMGHVLKALGDDDQAVVRAALDLLMRHGKGTDCLQALLGLLFRFSGELRHEVAAALRVCGGDVAADQLLIVLADPEQEEVHWICIDVLGEMFAALPGHAAAEAGS